MLDIAIHNPRQHRQFRHERGSLVLARGAAPASLWMAVDATRAANGEALVEISAGDNGITLAMSGCVGECYCGRACGLSGNSHLEMPARFSVGDTRFEITDGRRAIKQSRRKLERLHAHATRSGDGMSSINGRRNAASKGLDPRGQLAGPSPATLSRWFAALGALQHWATSPQELYVQAARCAVEAIGLDGAMILRRRDAEWEIAASHLPQPELGIHCDLAILDQLLATPETLFHGIGENHKSKVECEAADELAAPVSHPALDPRHSALALSDPAVVVSPLKSSTGELRGAIYGYRSIRAGNGRRGIRYLEANLIELLARAVCDGTERLERAADVDRQRALSKQAAPNSKQSAGEQREVTLLFADLCGFTELSAELTHEATYELLGQVMDCLTAAVMDHDGLVVDYYGDGLAAMWNAPADQLDHVELACRAALRMTEMVPDVAADWGSLLEDRQLRLGIGVHTGIVQVGNAGSRRREKYGPRGANVHVASRIEGAAKKLGLPLVVSGACLPLLSNRFCSYRVCRARLRGIPEPIDLYELLPSVGVPTKATAIEEYSESLRLFEAGSLSEAAERIASLDPNMACPPAAFLADEIDRALGRQKRRRRSDTTSADHRGVIAINAK